MAIYLNGMNQAEQQALTEAMLQSGSILNFSDIPKPKADKHSTGGVGDKTSLLIAPLVAACGACVPMISGRGLGHTGTAELAPADKKMYALRDATSTVEAIPLIVASIISKKGAAGLDVMVIDVKVGSGAFMRDEARAKELAHALVSTGNSCGIKTRALLTDMNQPLGRAVGNSIEVKECIDILRGEVADGVRPVLDLSLELSAHMLVLAKLDKTIEAAHDRLRRTLDSGAALESLRSNIAAQGGEPRVCDAPAAYLPLVSETFKVESPRSGFITSVDTTEIGHAIAAIGGGRVRIEDVIDPTVGFVCEMKIGDKVRAGDAIGVVYCRDESKARQAAQRIQSAYNISDDLPPVDKLIKEIINE